MPEAKDLFSAVTRERTQGGSWLQIAEAIEKACNNPEVLQHYPTATARLTAAAQASNYSLTYVQRLLACRRFLVDRVPSLDQSPPDPAAVEFIRRLHAIAPDRAAPFLNAVAAGSRVTVREARDAFEKALPTAPPATLEPGQLRRSDATAAARQAKLAFEALALNQIVRHLGMFSPGLNGVMR